MDYINNKLTYLRLNIQFYLHRFYCYLKKLRKFLKYYDYFTLFTIITIFFLQTTLIIMNYYFTILCLFDIIIWNIFKDYRYKKSFSNFHHNLINIHLYNNNDYNIKVAQWIGNRNYMEDTYSIDIKNNVYSVFDGHGGNQISNLLSYDFNHEIKSNMIEEIDKDLISYSLENIEKNTKKCNMKSGAVLSVVKIDGHKIQVNNIGDTYVIIVYEDLTYELINNPHTLYNFDEYVRYGEDITLSSVMRTKTGLIPTRTLGDHRHKKKDDKLLFHDDINILKLDEIKKWKYILNCSDGIFDALTYKEVIDIINRYNDIQLSMRELQIRTTKKYIDIYDKIFGLHYGDNCTIMIIENNIN